MTIQSLTHGPGSSEHLTGCEVRKKGEASHGIHEATVLSECLFLPFILEITISTPTVRAPFGDMNHQQDVDHLFPLIAIFLYTNVIHFCLNVTI